MAMLRNYAATQTAAASACGLALIAAGVRYSSQTIRQAGIGVLGLAGAKLAIVDLWDASAATRVGVLLLLGTALLAASFLYSRYLAAEDRQQGEDLDSTEPVR